MLSYLNRNQRLLLGSYFIWSFGIMLYWHLQPLYIAQLGASPGEIGFVLGVSGLLVTAFYIPVGMWADRRGRKPVMIAGWTTGMVSALLMALAPDWRWVIPAQIVFNMANFSMPAANGYTAASCTPGQNVARVFALMFSVSAIGSIISPALGGWLAEVIGLRAVYGIAIGLFGISTLFIFFLDPQPVQATRATANPRQLLFNLPFLLQVFFAFYTFFVLELGQVLMPKFLQDVRGLSLSQIGWMGTAAAVSVAILSLVWSQFPTEKPWAFWLSQMAAIAGLLVWLSFPHPAFIMFAYFIYGGERTARSLISARLTRSLTPATVSLGYGFYETALRLSLALAPSAAGFLYTHNPAWPLLVSLLGLIVAVPLAGFIPFGKQPE